MSHIVDECYYKGYRIVIAYDEFTTTDDVARSGTFWAFHGKYKLGDEPPSWANPLEFDCWDDFAAGIRERLNVKVLLPVYLYDHGGITISTTPFSCSWDSGQVGFVFADDPAFDGMTEDDITSALRSEIAEYAEVLEGHTYEYRVIDPEGDELGSCCGFIGTDNSALLEYAKDDIEAELRRRDTGVRLVAEHFAL